MPLWIPSDYENVMAALYGHTFPMPGSAGDQSATFMELYYAAVEAKGELEREALWR